MIKELVKLLIVGSSCTSVAVISTRYAGIDGDTGESKVVDYEKKKITEINSYGDIDAYGKQNKCAFRIVDDTKDQEEKEYSLAEFLFEKEKEIEKLEDRVVKVAKAAKKYCGVNSSVMAIFYSNVDKKKEPSGKGFLIKTKPLIKDSEKPPK